jgi:lipopolysaccharide/colanic/teichoic acid biosynthesis glycosyltransferase
MNKISTFFIRILDIIFSFMAILILFPFMLPIMIILKLTGEHDVFYLQKRVGRYGKEFNLIKFATMLRDSPNLPGGLYTYKNDPRLLPIGKFLRKTKINELPQFLNVLLGQLSLVGYRPLVHEGYDEYSNEIKKKLYNIKPGLSGIGSIALRNEEEIIQNVNNKEEFYFNIIIPYKGELEKWFVNNFSIILYFKIIFITILILIKPSSRIWMKVFNNLPQIPVEIDKNMKTVL